MLHSFVASERKLIAHGIQLKTLSDGAWRDGCEGTLPIQLHWSRILIDWIVVDITRRSMCESLGGKVPANLLISDNPPSPTKKKESHIKELWGDAGWAPPPHTLNGVIAQSWSALCLARPLSRCNYPAVFFSFSWNNERSPRPWGWWESWTSTEPENRYRSHDTTVKYTPQKPGFHGVSHSTTRWRSNQKQAGSRSGPAMWRAGLEKLWTIKMHEGTEKRTKGICLC